MPVIDEDGLFSLVAAAPAPEGMEVEEAAPEDSWDAVSWSWVVWRVLCMLCNAAWLPHRTVTPATSPPCHHCRRPWRQQRLWSSSRRAKCSKT